LSCVVDHVLQEFIPHSVSHQIQNLKIAIPPLTKTPVKTTSGLVSFYVVPAVSTVCRRPSI
jgi:hypothetical protein